MGFHEIRISDRISYGSRGGPGFNTGIFKVESGAEERVGRWESPLHQYDASYSIKEYQHLREIRKFFLARRGALYGFRWKDFLDFTTKPSGTDADVGTPAFTDQIIGVGDGVQVQFQLQKTYEDDILDFIRIIEKPVLGTVVSGVAGVQKTISVDWTVDTATGIVTYGVAPTLGQSVTAGCQFDVPVRFGENADAALQVAHDDFGSGSIPSIPIEEIRSATELPDIFPYGGCTNWGVITTDVSISLGLGRLQVVEPTAAGKRVILPRADDLPEGGPLFYVTNRGTQTIAIVNEDLSVLVAALAVGATSELLLGTSTADLKIWIAR